MSRVSSQRRWGRSHANSEPQALNRGHVLGTSELVPFPTIELDLAAQVPGLISAALPS